MDERPVQQNQAASREHAWIPAATLSELRAVITAYLNGRRDIEAEVERVAGGLATAAHDGGHAAERMLISLRALWREFAISQLDRLQLAALYDRLVRRAIDRYYED
ncbi:MAG TPA: hypothetical protein VG868_08915 [Casimicrobiaceae bacterium]|nr:hypothetical protein [Casimicrobiaceae bacterium]